MTKSSARYHQLIMAATNLQIAATATAAPTTEVLALLTVLLFANLPIQSHFYALPLDT